MALRWCNVFFLDHAEDEKIGERDPTKTEPPTHIKHPTHIHTHTQRENNRKQKCLKIKGSDLKKKGLDTTKQMGSQQGDAFFFSYTPEPHFLNDQGELMHNVSWMGLWRVIYSSGVGGLGSGSIFLWVDFLITSAC